MEDLGTLGGTYSRALDVNVSGQIVGYSATADEVKHAVLFTGGEIIDLNTFLPPELSGVILSEATKINDQGHILAKGMLPDGDTHTFLLVPEPGSLSLLALVGLALTRRKR